MSASDFEASSEQQVRADRIFNVLKLKLEGVLCRCVFVLMLLFFLWGAVSV